MSPTRSAQRTEAESSALAVVGPGDAQVACECEGLIAEALQFTDGEPPAFVDLAGRGELAAAIAVAGAALLAGFASGMKSCQSGTHGGMEGDFRQVGIYVKQPTPTLDRSDEPQESPEAAETTFAAEAAQRPDVEDRPPVDLPLPTEGPPLVGPGAVAPSVLPDVRDLPRPSTIRNPNAMAAHSRVLNLFIRLPPENGTKLHHGARSIPQTKCRALRSSLSWQNSSMLELSPRVGS
jgi:hypothetical protein